MKYYLSIMLFLSAVTGVTCAVNPQVTLTISGAANGTIVLELYKDAAPVTIANFLNYVQSGFYDNLIFHRVIKDFMIQAGGFDANLVYKTPGPSILNESTNRLSNLTGTVAMARGNHPHSASSQFFINHADNGFLDFGAIAYDGNNTAYYRAGYCVFGRVISGMDVVNDIASLTTSTQDAMENVPVQPVIIQSATITVNSPVCAEPLEGDVNGDCIVNIEDLLLLARAWMTGNQIFP